MSGSAGETGAGLGTGVTGGVVADNGRAAASSRVAALTQAAPGAPLKVGIEVVDYGTALQAIGANGGARIEPFAERYLTTGSRIGIIYTDFAPYRRALGALQLALSQHGSTVTDSAALSNASNLNDISAAGGPTANAVVRFRSERIDHVIFWDSGTEAFLFMNAAASQGYKPCYAFTSNDIGFVDHSPPPGGQLDGSVGLSWYPAQDGSANPLRCQAGTGSLWRNTERRKMSMQSAPTRS